MTGEPLLNEVVFKHRGRRCDFIPKYPDLEDEPTAWACEIIHMVGPLRGVMVSGYGKTAREAFVQAVKVCYSPWADDMVRRSGGQDACARP